VSLVNSQIHGHGFIGTSIVVVLDGLYRGNVTLYVGCDCKQGVAIKARGKNGSGDNDRTAIDLGTTCGNTEGGISRRFPYTYPFVSPAHQRGETNHETGDPNAGYQQPGPRRRHDLDLREQKKRVIHWRGDAHVRAFSSLIIDHRARDETLDDRQRRVIDRVSLG